MTGELRCRKEPCRGGVKPSSPRAECRLNDDCGVESVAGDVADVAFGDGNTLGKPEKNYIV